MTEVRKTKEELLELYKQAGEGLTVGGKYAHYKHPEEAEYRIISVALREEDFEPMVVYELIDTGTRCIRTKNDFLEEVEWEGEKTPRFMGV